MPYSDDSIGGDGTMNRNVVPSAPAAPDQLIGVTLNDRYLIEQKLGQGGFGSVYLALDSKVASRRIVIKVLHAEDLLNDWSKKKFQQELEALGRIDHPGVVGVSDSGETPDGRPYIVMQYIDGVSLRSLITAEGINFVTAANVVQQVGKALSAAHQAGIFHRDLKPENIMIQTLDNDEYVKVIDFGIAKVLNSVVDVVTSKDVAVGTIAYMSPEQLSAQPMGPESDVYAMGVIAYEMITGKRPTNPESAFQLLDLQRSGVRVKPSDLRPGLPIEAEKVILKALSFSPEDRYERARDFGDILAAALLGDDEQTLLASGKVFTNDEQVEDEPSLETAHVLFVDIVGYSRLLIDEQSSQLKQLQYHVTSTTECQHSKTAGNLIALPTGDGMALVFFNDPEAPVRCAVELSRALKSTPNIKLRMGVHSGLVYRMSDIKNNMNVAGGGINIAQRVMDCGDDGHILVSKRVADDLGQLARWSSSLQDLGNAEVKHGVVVHVFNLYGDDFGNSSVPAKLQKIPERPQKRVSPIAIGAGAIFLVLIAGLIFWQLSSRQSTVSNTVPTAVTPISTGPERSLIYWLTYQKMRDGKPDSEVRKSAGNDIFGNGWRFQFNLTPGEAGALYLLSVGPGKDRTVEYNILFPLPGVGQSNPTLTANQPFTSDWARFVDETGVERIWIIWSAKPIVELDSIFSHAVANQGVIAGRDEIAKIQSYLNQATTSVTADKEKKQTLVKGQGDILVSLVELTHEGN